MSCELLQLVKKFEIISYFSKKNLSDFSLEFVSLKLEIFLNCYCCFLLFSARTRLIGFNYKLFFACVFTVFCKACFIVFLVAMSINSDAV